MSEARRGEHHGGGDEAHRAGSPAEAQTRMHAASHLVTVTTAAAVVALAVAQGGYGQSARTVLALVCWGGLAAAVLAGWWPRGRVTPAAGVAMAGLVGLGLLAGLSALWADSAELAVIELDRDLMYAGLLALVVLAGRPGEAERWVTGLSLGISVVAALAIGQRCLPSLFPADHTATFLPGVRTRLSYPVGYWNGLAILVGLGLPLLLRGAVGATSAARRGLALAPFPVIGAVIYLASSRGGAAVALVGAACFVALSGRRLGAFAAVAVGAAAVAVAAVVLRAAPRLVDGPLGSPAAISQGHRALALIAASSALVALAWGVASSTALRLPALPRTLTRALAGAGVLVLIGGLLAVHPARAWRHFKQPPTVAAARGDYVAAHLLSGTGSGRWQFWSTAWNEFTSRPWLGRGAGSFAAWWSQHAPIAYFARDAHSLYLQTLGELGLAGMFALAAAVLAGLVTAAARVRAAVGAERDTLAALAATFLAFLLAAGIDWMWQLTVVGAIGIVCLGLLTGPASAPQRVTTAGPSAHAAPRAGVPLARLAGLAGLAVLAIAVLTAEAAPELSARGLAASQAAVRRGQLVVARDDALRARALAPWASSPWLQLALVYEAGGNDGAARAALSAATRRDGGDWQPWLVAARIDTRAGLVTRARGDLAEARRRDPRSPLLAPSGEEP